MINKAHLYAYVVTLAHVSWYFSMYMYKSSKIIGSFSLITIIVSTRYVRIY